MKEVSKLLRKVIALQREEKLIPAGAKVLVALSGGVDSVVLSHALLELKGFFSISRIALAHFNHMLREEADEEEEFCREFGKSLGLEVFIGKEEVRKRAKEKKKNLEETARELRYSFLREVKEREGFDIIATAHHLSDLVETSLLWLVRGAGMEGFIGFEPREKDVVRPLYRATKEEIIAYAKAKNLKWIEDKSNRDTRFFRNKLRIKVIPILKELNPNLEETFLRTREVFKEENEFLEGLSSNVLGEVLKGECIRVADLKEKHPAIQRRVLRSFSKALSFSKVEQLRRLLYRGGELDLGGGLKAVRKGPLLCLKKNSH
ncbi:MAG TPA: tRNA lysidine(34) synthetase TilS [Aquificaceae bacterium]|nr:tRNA lysidine(34) synthetase TilS [Aquificaceae bacterium]